MGNGNGARQTHFVSRAMTQMRPPPRLPIAPARDNLWVRNALNAAYQTNTDLRPPRTSGPFSYSPVPQTSKARSGIFELKSMTAPEIASQWKCNLGCRGSAADSTEAYRVA